MLQLDKKGHFYSNIGAVLGQIATGGGGGFHLEEQMHCKKLCTCYTKICVKKLQLISHNFLRNIYTNFHVNITHFDM